MNKDQVISNSSIITVDQLIRIFLEGYNNEERFCFILGSGASVDSGIPMGGTLENRWMKTMMGEDLNATMKWDPVETRNLAKILKAENVVQYDFQEIEDAWNKIKNNGKGTMPSKYYFDLFKIRFHPAYHNGYQFLEKLMEDKQPGFGYRILAKLLTDGKGSNFVISTNFDNLVEDALSIYTNVKPIVINHELLADYIERGNKRPCIAKIHRGMFFDPLNDPEQTNGLKGKWHDILQRALYTYTPIVLGYGGGDHSLMDFLKEDNTKLGKGIYWCYIEEYGLPNKEIQELVKNNRGCFVKIKSFDQVMFKIGNALYQEEISFYGTQKFLSNQLNARLADYERKFNDLSKEKQGLEKEIASLKNYNQKEIAEREKQGSLTAWDYVRLGNDEYERKHYEKAIRYYDKAIALNPEYANAYSNRGAAYYKQKRYKDALTDYNEAVALNPEDSTAYNNRGSVYYNQKRYEEALADFNKALTLNSEYVSPYKNRGNVYYDQNRYELALEDYNKALALKPNDAATHYNRGNVYRIQKRYEEALTDYGKAIALNPENASAYANRGLVYYKQKRYKDALEDYNKALALDSEGAHTLNNRAYLYAEIADYERALNDINKAIDLDENCANFYDTKGTIFYKMEKYRDAIREFDKALELDPDKDIYIENKVKAEKALAKSKAEIA